MKCCDSRVVLKKSKLGTKFFAHTRRGECASAPESAEHLLAKELIAKAVQSVNWVALTEEAGISPSGESWIADVLAKQGAKKIAFEVQWSQQTAEETQRRQNIYKNSQVRGLWLMRQIMLPLSKELPAFRLRRDESQNSFEVLIPSIFYNPFFINHRTKDESLYWQHIVPLDQFIQGALTGKLKFAPLLGMTVPVEVCVAESKCWKCKRSTNLIISLIFKASELLKNHPDISTEIYQFDSPEGQILINKIIPREKLKQLKIGEIKQRFSKTVGGKYLSNGCFHCDALQGQFFDHDLYFDQVPVFRSEVLLNQNVINMLEKNDSIYRWWFSE